jgi:hypothetical protein
MKNYKIKQFGSNAQGIEITGNPANQEPEHVIVKLPFGEVEIARTLDGSYWVHVSKKKDAISGEFNGSLSRFRLDSIDNEGLYLPEIDGEHLAILMGE